MNKPLRRLLAGVLITGALGIGALSTLLVDGACHRNGLGGAPNPKLAKQIAEAAHGSWEDVSISANDGASLRGWLFRPEGQPKGSVMVLHGVGDNRSGATGHIAYLLRGHYAVLVADSRARGESGGDLITYGVQERHDVAAWAAWLRETIPGSVYGIGISMGAGVILQSLPEAGFQAVVAESPFRCFEAIAMHRILPGSGWSRTLATPLGWAVVESGFLYARLRYNVNLADACPEHSLPQDGGKTRVLLVHGSQDTNIPATHSRALLQVLPKGTMLWEVQDAEHVQVFARERQKYEKRVLDFFAE